MVLTPGQALDTNFRGKPRGIKPDFSSAEAEREGGIKNTLESQPGLKSSKNWLFFRNETDR
jgi:hypothetical protein